MSDGPQVVILAAGEGTRMRSARPKALHHLGGRPLIDHVVDSAQAVTTRKPVVVVSPDQTAVAEWLAERTECVMQAQPLGTGDALRSVPPKLRSDGAVVVLYADVPLIGVDTLTSMINQQQLLGSPCVLLAATPPDPGALGRLNRSADGRVAGIVEVSELTDVHGDLREVNVGVYVFEGRALWPLLDELDADNSKGEVFLTDVVELIGGADTVELTDLDQAIGVNDRVQLARAEQVLRSRTLETLMLAGVTIVDPATTYIASTVEIGQDSVIHPMTVITGETKLGGDCQIGPLAQLSNVVAGDGVEIGSSVLEDCRLGDGVQIGHFDRVRPDSDLGNGVSLGTHAEVKNSTIGAGSRISHFACVLDSDVGEAVNIGAGTVTCNYDGHDKARTVIGDRVFVGTNSTLVAPVTLEADSYVAAGSVVTTDVPSGALGVGRAKQRNVEGWVARRQGPA